MQTGTKRKKLKRAIYGSALVAAIALLPQLFTETTYFTSFAANFFFRSNLHEVVPGRFFRAAEMSREDLAETIKKYGIHTVVDLRLQPDAPDESGKSEQEVAGENGAKYHWIPFSSSKMNQQNKVRELLEVFDTAAPPVLVHCSSGTHRSGLASAIWLLDKEHAPIAKAEEQLSLKYGFFQFERDLKELVQGSPTLDDVLWQYADAARGSRQTFREWLEHQPRTGQYVP